MNERRKPPGRARPARDDDETRKVQTGGGDALVTAQAEADTAPPYAIREASDASLLAEMEAKARRCEAREKRLDELVETFLDEIDPEAAAVDRYVEELEEKIEELEVELDVGPKGRRVWIAGLNDLEGTWIPAIVLGGTIVLGSTIPDDPVPVTRSLAEVRFADPGSEVGSEP